MTDTVKLTLNALSNFIEINTVHNNSELDEKEKKDMEQEEKENNQNFLNSNNAVMMLFSILSDY